MIFKGGISGSKTRSRTSVSSSTTEHSPEGTTAKTRGRIHPSYSTYSFILNLFCCHSCLNIFLNRQQRQQRHVPEKRSKTERRKDPRGPCRSGRSNQTNSRKEFRRKAQQDKVQVRNKDDIDDDDIGAANLRSSSCAGWQKFARQVQQQKTRRKQSHYLNHTSA